MLKSVEKPQMSGGIFMRAMGAIVQSKDEEDGRPERRARALNLGLGEPRIKASERCFSSRGPGASGGEGG